MARIRSIKPELWVDEKVVEMSPWARLLFIGIWNFADDQGFIDYAPKRIKMQVFPGDSVEIETLVAELLGQGLVKAYQSPIGPVLHVVNWARHQRVDHAAKERFSTRDLRPFDPRDPSGKSREGGFDTTDPQTKNATCRSVSNISHKSPREGSREVATTEWLQSPWSGHSDGPNADVLPIFGDDPREGSRTLAPEGKGIERKGKERTIAPKADAAVKAAPRGARNTTGNIDFDRFYYGTYPKRVARARALKAWMRAIKTTPADVIIAGAERYRDERAGKDPKFTAHPEAWLNGERWLDDPEQPSIPEAPAHIYLNPTDPHAYDGYATAKDTHDAA